MELNTGTEFDVVLDNKTPKRPHIPVLLFCSLSLWMMCAICFVYLRTLFAIVKPFLPLLLVFIFLIALFSINKKIRKISLIIAFSMLGVFLGFSENVSLDQRSQDIVSSSTNEFYATLTEDAAKSDFGSQAVIEVKDTRGKAYRLQGYFNEDNDLLCGEEIKFISACKSLKQSSIDYNYNKGVCASVSIGNFERVQENIVLESLHTARKIAIENFEKYSGVCSGLLQALVCGYRNTIKDDGTYDQFRICGLAHVVAVSGAHLAIVVAVFLFFLKKIRAPRKVVVVLSTLFVLCYLVFSGIPISAIRSTIMVVLGLIAGLFGRRATPVNALALALIGFIVIDPATCVSVSLFLSATSTLGIILFASLIGSWFEVKSKKIDTLLVQPCSLTIASNIVTMPYSASLFSQISTIAIFSNIVATPLFSLGCVTGLISACVGIIFPTIASFAGFLAMCCAYPLKISVMVMSLIPYASIPINADVILSLGFSALLCFLLFVLWPQFKRKQFASGLLLASFIAVLFVFLMPSASGNRIVVLDVGQGDAILIESGARRILVDTGNQKSKLKEGLAKEGVTSLDAVIITHHDDDHMGCLDDLNSYEVINSVYSSDNALTCSCDGCKELSALAQRTSDTNSLSGLNVGDKIKVGTFTCEVVWPEQFEDEGGNADSVCLLVSNDENSDGKSEFKMLLTGDAESQSTNKIVNSRLVSGVDILKVAHHGSKPSLDDELLNSLNPKTAIISVGSNNRYGHPKQETLNFLNVHNVQTLRTDQNGSIIISSKLPSGYSIKTSK